MKKSLSIICIGLLLISLTGCGKVPKLENGEEVVIELKEKKFTTNDLYNKLKEQYGAYAVVELVDNYIVDTELKDDKESEDEAKNDADGQIESYKLQAEQYGYSWNDYLTLSGIENEDVLRTQLMYNYKKNIVLENYIKNNLISDSEIESYYNGNVFGNITARHILIAPNVTDEMTDDEKSKAEDEALKKAKDLIEKLNNGESFETLVKEHSNDEGSKENGGLIENFSKDSVVSEFWDASNNLNIGEYSKSPVKSQFGYHIILKVSQEEKPSLDTAKDDILEKLTTNKLSSDTNLSNDSWKKIRENYGFTIHDDDVKKSYNNLIK